MWSVHWVGVSVVSETMLRGNVRLLAVENALHCRATHMLGGTAPSCTSTEIAHGENATALFFTNAPECECSLISRPPSIVVVPSGVARAPLTRTVCDPSTSHTICSDTYSGSGAVCVGGAVDD
jgi:hypothetical protein